MKKVIAGHRNIVERDVIFFIAGLISPPRLFVPQLAKFKGKSLWRARKKRTLERFEWATLLGLDCLELLLLPQRIIELSFGNRQRGP